MYRTLSTMPGITDQQWSTINKMTIKLKDCHIIRIPNLRCNSDTFELLGCKDYFNKTGDLSLIFCVSVPQLQTIIYDEKGKPIQIANGLFSVYFTLSAGILSTAGYPATIHPKLLSLRGWPPLPQQPLSCV